MTWKTIGLTDPMTTGPHVRDAQHLLNHNPYGDHLRGAEDGQFGPITAAGVKETKFYLGYPKSKITSNFGAVLHSYLNGTKKLPLTYRVRRSHRAKAAVKHPSIRDNVVKWWEWGIRNEHQIHYAQNRPILFPPSGHLPLTTDCSGFTILVSRWAGVPAHPGIEYNGAGSSLNMGGSMPRISLSTTQVGDLVCWPGHHVAVIISKSNPSNPTLGSHGLEAGPLRISLADEAAYHRRNGHGEPVFLRLI